MTIELNGSIMLVGAGKMGGAMLEGWLDKGLDPAHVTILDPQLLPAMAMMVKTKGITHATNIDDKMSPSVILLAVKPQIMGDVAPKLKPLISNDTLVISIAAGLETTNYQPWLGNEAPLVRVMPNTPASIGQGMSVAYANTHVTQAHKKITTQLMEAVGKCAWVKDEALMDIVTALSGSGPAYIFLLAECMMQAGIEGGLDKDTARLLSEQTVAGAGMLLGLSEENATTLRQNVTSPNGTTQAALEKFNENNAMQSLVSKAIARAADRSRELKR